MTSLQEEQFETFEKHFPLGSRVLSVKILMQGGNLDDAHATGWIHSKQVPTLPHKIRV